MSTGTRYSVLRAVDDGLAFNALLADPAFAAVEAHPIYGEFGRRYYPAVFGSTRSDQSFTVLERDRPILLVSCTAGARELDYFGLPVRFFPRADLATEEASKAIVAAFDHIDRMAVQHQLHRVTVGDHTSLGTLSAIGKQCLNRGADAVPRLSGLSDLVNGEGGIKRGLRKSFQSLINWGKRNLQIAIVGAENPDRALFARCQDFHRSVAGRVTRPQESWDAMFEWIAAGRGELVIGFLAGGELVTGTMVVDGTTTSYYASGVYDRERFELPLAHWPLWHAMLRSAERGMRRFDLGDLPLASTANPKEVAIGYFKRGFATNIATWLAWSWNIPEPKSTP